VGRFSPWPDAFFPLSPLRRTSARVIRWIALPLAAFCLLASLALVAFVHRTQDGLVPADALVLEARVVDASRIGSQYDLWVRYPSRGGTVEGPLRAWSTWGIAKGDTVHVFVDPANGRVRDDPAGLAWTVAGFGAVAAAFFVVVGFLGLGEMLRRDRVARGLPR